MRMQLNTVLVITLVVTTITVAGEYRDIDSQDGKRGTNMKKNRRCPVCTRGYYCCVSKWSWYSYGCCPLPPTTTTRRPTTTPTIIRPSQNSWARSEVKFEKSAFVTCGKNHHSVLSCGISNGRYQPMKYQLAFPRNRTACECRSTREAKCVVWCAFIVGNFHFAGWTCNSKTKVVACHPGNSNVRDLNF